MVRLGKWAFLLLTVVAAAPSSHGREIEDKKWTKATSENYVIYSRMSKGKTVDLLKHLETFRLVTGAEPGSDSIPTLIVVAGGAKEFVEVGGKDGYAGFFLPRIRSNYILLRSVRGMEEAGIVMHEYGHSLLRETSSFSYPAWYQEGYADYLSTVKVRGTRVELFNYPLHRAEALRSPKWLSPRALVNPPSRDSMSDTELNMFYAQSWALVHFLENRDDGGPGRIEGLKRYAKARASGLGKVAAFEESFELDIDTLNDRLWKYVFKECCRFSVLTLDEAVDTDKIETVRADKGEVAIALARMTRALGKSETAQRLYSVAAEFPDLKDEALAGLGAIADEAGERDAAQVVFAEIEGSDPLATLDRAYHYERMINRTDDLNEIGANQVKLFELIDSLHESGNRSPEFLLLAARHETPNRALALIEEAYLALPANMQTQAALVSAYINARQYRDAITFARIFKGWNFERPDFVSWLDDTIDTLESRLDTIETFSD